MEWESLEFSNADAVISESRSAVSALERLDRQMLAFNNKAQSSPEGEGGGGAQPSAATGKRLKEALDTLVAAIERRIEAIQIFYNNNDLNPLSSQFEMCRLMLKRALMQHAINASGGYLLQEMPPPPSQQPPQQQNASAPVASSLPTTAARTSGTSPLINDTYSVTPSFGGTGEGGNVNRTMSTMRTHSRVSSFGGPSSGGHQGGAGGGGRSTRSSFGTQRDIPFSQTPSSSFAPSSGFIGAKSSTSPPQTVTAAVPFGGGKESTTGGGGMVTLKVILTRDEYEEVLRRRRSRENASGR